MTPAPNEDFWRRLVKFNFWAISVCFIIENNKRKSPLRTYFSYLVQLVLFHCLNNSRIRPLLSGSIVQVHSKLSTTKRGLERQFYAQESVTQTYVRPEILQTGRPRCTQPLASSYFLFSASRRSGPRHHKQYRKRSSYIDRRVQPATVCESALSCSVDTLLHRQHN